MGYELHIRRVDEDNKITVQEWTNYINNAIDFEKTHELRAINPHTGLILQISCPNCGLWKLNKNLQVPFTYSDSSGYISVKNPDDIVIRKMIEISKHFHALVIGDEGEEYNESNLSQRI